MIGKKTAFYKNKFKIYYLTKSQTKIELFKHISASDIEERQKFILEVRTLVKIASHSIAHFDWHLCVSGADSQAFAHICPFVKIPIGYKKRKKFKICDVVFS